MMILTCIILPRFFSIFHGFALSARWVGNNTHAVSMRLTEYVHLWYWGLITSQGSTIGPVHLLWQNNKQDLTERERERIKTKYKKMIDEDPSDRGEISLMISDGDILMRSSSRNSSSNYFIAFFRTTKPLEILTVQHRKTRGNRVGSKPHGENPPSVYNQFRYSITACYTL